MKPYQRTKDLLKSNRRPVLMGIVNVTPDSFSDGGKHATTDLAVKHAKQLIADGALILDIGGESTRPGAKVVDLKTELQRVLPVIEKLRAYIDRTNSNVQISIDTVKPEVAAIALRYGADIVNDVSGLRNPLMRDVVRREECAAIIMHAPNYKGHINSIHKKQHRYKNVTKDVAAFFTKRIDECVESGIKKSQLIVDPGIGFGKNTQQNLELLHGLETLKKLRLPILVGASRKRFIGEITYEAKADERDAGTLAVHCIAYYNGASIIRAHNVKAHKQYFDALTA